MKTLFSFELHVFIYLFSTVILTMRSQHLSEGLFLTKSTVLGSSKTDGFSFPSTGSLHSHPLSLA